MKTILPSLENCTIAVIGLGYVGLPLALEFAKNQSCCLTGDSLHHRVIGFDVNTTRLDELRQGIDRTNETSNQDLLSSKLLEFTSDPEKLTSADVFIVTVPTPIDNAKRPDLTPLEKASAVVGRALQNRHSKVTPVVIQKHCISRCN